MKRTTVTVKLDFEEMFNSDSDTISRIISLVAQYAKYLIYNNSQDINIVDIAKLLYLSNPRVRTLSYVYNFCSNVLKLELSMSDIFAIAILSQTFNVIEKCNKEVEKENERKIDNEVL